MSHFNQFSAIATLEEGETQQSLYKALLDGGLEVRPERIQVRHYSSHLYGMEDYTELERTLSTDTISVEPFTVVLAATQHSRIGNHDQGFKVSHAHVRTSGPDTTKTTDKLEPLARLKDLGGEVTFIEQRPLLQAVEVNIPLMFVPSVWENRITRAGIVGVHPGFGYEQCTDCPDRFSSRRLE